MNWQDPVIQNVVINGKSFPRPGSVRILGVPSPGALLTAEGDAFPGESLSFSWENSENGTDWFFCGTGKQLLLPEGTAFVRVTATDTLGNSEVSRIYSVLPEAAVNPTSRLKCRGMFPNEKLRPDAFITRGELAEMLVPLAETSLSGPVPTDTQEPAARIAAANRFFPLDTAGRFHPEENVTREEMASVAMQACGVYYRNASSTMPVCQDASEVADNYGTNVARALYFGFMMLENGCFLPHRSVTVDEAVEIIDRVADFARI